MSSVKPPDHDANKPAVHEARMAPRAEAEPGLEQDSKGNVIPLSQRTKDDQEKARTGRKD
jgi:hypothetical protein